ncbi:MAG: DUF2505 domain-containing protein [Acidimicrobiales bacterium]
MKLTLHYAIDCPPERFWTLYFDRDYTTRLHREALGSTSVEIVEQHGDATSGIERTLRYGQRPDAPGPVKRIFGDEIITTEVSSFDPATGTSTFTVTPGTMADKTEIHGSISLEADGDRCRQTFNLEARVKIFGAGPVVERFIERQARDTQDKAVSFMNKELAG